MRTFILAAMLLSSNTVWGGESRESRSAPTHDHEPALTKEEVQRYTAVYFPEIRSCYVVHGHGAKHATGELSVRIVVRPSGNIHEVTIAAPGVVGARLRGLTRCIHSQVDTWRFPVRRYFTTATLPYYFMHHDIAGTGPQPSCWNPRGCRSPTRQPPRFARPR
jgi:hypothetical protein